jgi:hypothetical protein
LTAGVRRTLGRTNGRPGVKSTIWRAPTRSTACRPAWTSRATWAYEHRPRSATSTSPACKAGWTACTCARSWVRRGATTSLRSTPLPAWNNANSRATGNPHPGRCSVGWPNACCNAGTSGMEHPEPSTTKVRCPCHRPSADMWDCAEAQRRVHRSPKRSRGSFERAWQEADALNRNPDRGGKWLHAVLPCSICQRKSWMVVTGVSTRSRQAV